MDLMYFLRERTDFVRYLYGATVKPLIEVKRKISEREEPYRDMPSWDEHDDEPSFQTEWENAGDAAAVMGITCLGLVQSAFQSFLKEYLKEVGGQELVQRAGKKGNWFLNYKALFAESPEHDWTTSGADLTLIEQMILTRNDLQHNFGIFSNTASQSPDHAKKHPDSVFRDSEWPGGLLCGPAPLIVAPSQLEATIQAVEKLCDYLEAARHRRLGGYSRSGSRKSREQYP